MSFWLFPNPSAPAADRCSHKDEFPVPSGRQSDADQAAGTPEQRGPDEDIKADQEERLDQATEEIFR
jgi:hypothetical protein